LLRCCRYPSLIDASSFVCLPSMTEGNPWQQRLQTKVTLFCPVQRERIHVIYTVVVYSTFGFASLIHTQFFKPGFAR
jgi:hypothetical protein